jgi:hypothetical protein
MLSFTTKEKPEETYNSMAERGRQQFIWKIKKNIPFNKVKTKHFVCVYTDEKIHVGFKFISTPGT